jgi:hypothetical protein
MFEVDGMGDIGFGFDAGFEVSPDFAVPSVEVPDALPMDMQVLPTTEYDTMSGLRDGVQAYMYGELSDRLATDPVPTPTELQMNAYAQEIEPQVRPAVLTLWDKGYTTRTSGFGGNSPEAAADQVIQGNFGLLSGELVQGLAALGVTATSNEISFTPAAPDLPAMTMLWNDIANLFPPNPDPGEPFSRQAPASYAPGTYLQNWLDYGLGISVRPGLQAEIFGRNTPPSA